MKNNGLTGSHLTVNAFSFRLLDPDELVCDGGGEFEEAFRRCAPDDDIANLDNSSGDSASARLLTSAR